MVGSRSRPQRTLVRIRGHRYTTGHSGELRRVRSPGGPGDGKAPLDLEGLVPLDTVVLPVGSLTAPSRRLFASVDRHPCGPGRCTGRGHRGIWIRTWPAVGIRGRARARCYIGGSGRERSAENPAESTGREGMSSRYIIPNGHTYITTHALIQLLNGSELVKVSRSWSDVRGKKVVAFRDSTPSFPAAACTYIGTL